MNDEKTNKIMSSEELDDVLPKYEPIKLSGKNLAQNYVSAFNTGMNIYQCVNYLQGNIDWTIKAVNDVVKSWNTEVSESIDQSKAIVRETTTEQFNTEWTNKQPELIEQVNTLTTNQFNNEKSVFNDELKALNARMDTFTKLSEGSTTSDAELQDIRIGANGIIYDTAGDAVRGQYKQLKEHIFEKINKPTSDDNNKFPRAKDGNVEWVEQGLPTNEQTSNAINNWLDAHPDATTTVQDDSLTESKFSKELRLKTIKDYVTPQMFGAKADGITDDSDAFNYMFESLPIDLGSMMVYIPKGTYAIKKTIIISDKWYMNVKCDGRIKNIASENTPTFLLTNVKYCIFTGMWFYSGNNNCFKIGAGCVQINISNSNFYNIYNYAIDVDYSGGTKPNYIQIEDATCVYTYGLIKDVAPDTTYGTEIIIRGIKFTSAPKIQNLDVIPAFMYFRNIHDIFICDLMGASESSIMLFERDCSGQVQHFNVSSFKLPSIKFVEDDYVGSTFNISDFLIYNYKGGESVTNIIGIDLDRRTNITFDSFRIEGCDTGIKVGNINNISMNGGSFKSNNKHINLTDFDVNYVNLKTIISCTDCKFYDGYTLYSDTPLGYKQQVYISFGSCYFEGNFSLFTINDICNIIELNNCIFNNDDSKNNSIPYFRDNHRLVSTPNKGVFQKGYVIYNKNPTDYIGWVCTTAGAIANKQWSANTDFSYGDIVYFTTQNQYCMCVVEGTSGETQPNPTTSNSVIDGTITWLSVANTQAKFKQYGAVVV